MFPYAQETFTDDEQDILRRYVTNLDQPVFALVNLPEVVKGALFARYSRSPKSLRRLFLDEFVGDLDISGDASVDATVGVRRAVELYERVFVEYGDDSVAQLGGVHLACEQASNLLTKVLEWGRLMAYLEQSTRYIAYNQRLGGRYRYYRDPAVLDSPLGARYVGEMDRMFDTYGELLEKLQAWLTVRHPRGPGDSDFVHRQAVRAKALDALARPSAGGVAFERRHLRHRSVLRAAAHPHARPPVARGAPLRGHDARPNCARSSPRSSNGSTGRIAAGHTRPTWSGHARRPRDLVEELFPDLVAPLGHQSTGPAGMPSVTLVDFDPEGEEKVLAAICAPLMDRPEAQVTAQVRRLGAEERRSLLAAYVGERANRRHRPGRALERTSYRFEVVTDYGAFRDLQRHRMLTIEWQPLGTALGYDVPGLVEEAGLADRYVASLERSRVLTEQLAEPFPVEAAYAVALAYRIRYTMQMNAREAMHLDRVAVRSGGTSELPLGGPRDAPPHRRGGRPSAHGRRHEPRRLRRPGSRAARLGTAGRRSTAIAVGCRKS